jgi:hypothetical protein
MQCKSISLENVFELTEIKEDMKIVLSKTPTTDNIYLYKIEYQNSSNFNLYIQFLAFKFITTNYYLKKIKKKLCTIAVQ